MHLRQHYEAEIATLHVEIVVLKQHNHHLTEEKQNQEGQLQKLIKDYEVQAVNYIETIDNLERQISRLNSENTKLGDTIDDIEVHKITQASMASQNKQDTPKSVGDEPKEKQASYVQRIKKRKRAPKKDADFTYQKPKKIVKKDDETEAKKHGKEIEVVEVDNLLDPKEKKDSRDFFAVINTSMVSSFLCANEKNKLIEIFKNAGPTSNAQWTHYNSFQPRTKRTKDHYFEDAKKMMKYIQGFMKEHVELGVFKVNDIDGPL